jgi:EAL domain-containing protein (putative c-di-GMP-specific phosphodiesterase class I)
LPLHVPISEALLSESDELDRVLSALGEHRDAAKGIVLSVPAVLIERHARYAEAVETLAGTGVRLAAEGWSGNKDGLEKMKRNGVVLLKLSADRLLGRTKLAKATNTAIRLVEVASALDIPVVAVNVANDEDAVSLIDLGVTLMTGNRFSGPRRLRPRDGAKPERIAGLQGHTG